MANSDTVRQMGLVERLQCLNSGRMAKRVQEDYKNGVASGITGTPGNILINNKTGKVSLASGAIPLNRLQKIVKRLKVQ